MNGGAQAGIASKTPVIVIPSIAEFTAPLKSLANVGSWPSREVRNQY